MKIRDVIRLIEADGWYLVATKGSYRQYKHPINRAVSPSPVIQVTIWLQARLTAF